MSTEENKNSKSILDRLSDQSQGTWKEQLNEFFKELLDIRSNTDRETTIEHIVEDITFKGHTAWILVCSIFIASIGLNANSTPVVIGAMLISPLMGPILGIGMSVAINDLVTLKRSLINFGVMVAISIVTAFIFFYVFPLKAESSELLARTAPDIRDVLIAFFGGLALIIARTKKGTIASVIFGVAIATALMPPLCTAGFGLAIGNFSYFFGAMYLFVINTIFIALATYLILKLLRFPLVKYANQAQRTKTTRIIYVIALIALLPAMYTFYKVFQESIFHRDASMFVNKVVSKTSLPADAKFVKELTKYNYLKNGDKSTIELVFMGDAKITESVKETWKNHMEEYSRLSNTELHIIQGGRDDEDENRQLMDMYNYAKKESASKDEIIAMLKEGYAKQEKVIDNGLKYKDIFAKSYTSFSEIESLSCSKHYASKGIDQIDSSVVVDVVWKKEVSKEELESLSKRYLDWLKLEIPKDKGEIKLRYEHATVNQETK